MLTTFLKEWRLVTINTNSIISFLVQISVLLYLQFVVMLKLNKKKGIEILFVMMYYLYLSYYLFWCVSGYNLIRDPHHNKGLAFSEKERDAHYLRGLLPPVVISQELQVF